MTPSLTVLCDFDGTVTSRDVLWELLNALAEPSWQAIEADWQQGRIGSRECLARQIPLIRGGWPAIERMLKAVTLDPTFPDFAAWCASCAVSLIIVSDGLDRVIQWLLARERVVVDAIWSNRLLVSSEGALSVDFPHPPQDADCRAGLCKCRALAKAASRRVIVGDGLSDLCWASRADYCFAKGRLLELCQAQNIPCAPFENFAVIQRRLSHLLAEGRRPLEAPFSA